MPATTKTTDPTMPFTAARVRQDFLDFFTRSCGHTFAPSSPAVPVNDPTLLFTNAGMNQFKDVFLGRGTRDYTRAVNTQKCIRAGGKHNDLEDVGRDCYHHTFFEMLGNWSFGDYFKKEAIAWAWELLTKVWGIAPRHLYATYFEGDSAQGLEPDLEARDLWLQYLPKDHVLPGNAKDNFWEMGETGPCGPCSEIHYDGRSDEERRSTPGRELVNRDHPDVLEIWNLVFIQFNRGEDRRLTPLPAKHVDTGLGLERIVRVLQGKSSNYDTDLFTPIFAAIQRLTGARAYTGKLDDPIDIAYRVAADHIRTLVIAIADDGRPGNEGRGYVLRRILRRAVRHARQTLGADGPMLHELVPVVVELLGGTFPELAKNPRHIQEIIRSEEEAFLKTLDRGLALFDEVVTRSGASRIIPAEDAFQLHDTFGFPIDLTQIMAEERGLSVDVAGFDRLMNEAREKSRAGGGETDLVIALPPDALARLKAMNIAPTDDSAKHDGRPVTAELAAIWNGRDFDNQAVTSRRLAFIFNRTSFYAESGGQMGDRGDVFFTFDTTKPDAPLDAGARLEIEDTQQIGGYILHIGTVKRGTVRVGHRGSLTVDAERRFPTRLHHTTTHLLNHALRQVLGDEVEQRGSLVAPDRLRFDFSFSRALTEQELNAAERLVNAGIHQKMPVHTEDVPLALAKRINGVRAVFGEKYPDPVRVVSIGPSIDRLVREPDLPRWRECSIEFCGGTHAASTDEARKFVITQETALAAGVRRITAVAGPAALAADLAGKNLEARAFRARTLAGEELVEEFNNLTRETDELTVSAVARTRIRRSLDEAREKMKHEQKSAQASARQAVVDQARVLAENLTSTIIVERILGADKDTLLAALDVVKAKRPDSATMLLSGSDDEAKVMIAAYVPKALIAKGLKAGDWVKVAASVCGGGGGGRPDLAQAGGKDPNKIPDAITAAQTHARERTA